MGPDRSIIAGCRTVATGLQRLGVRLEVTEAVVNHLSGSGAGVVGIYQRHDWAEEKRSALDEWSAHLLAAAEVRLPVGKVLPFSLAGSGRGLPPWRLPEQCTSVEAGRILPSSTSARRGPSLWQRGASRTSLVRATSAGAGLSKVQSVDQLECGVGFC